MLLSVLLLLGCYHAVVETGAAPSDQVVERCCQASFLGGLVAARPVRSDPACPNGIARVEASRSFSNLVFTLLTATLYSPVSVSITCAAPPAAALVLPPGPLQPAPDYDPPWFVIPEPSSAAPSAQLTDSQSRPTP
jgi:Bor protein